MWNPLAGAGDPRVTAEVDRLTGTTQAERMAVPLAGWLAEQYDRHEDARGNWRVGRRRYTDVNEALEAAGFDEIRWRDSGVVYSGLDPLAADKAERYERERRQVATRARGHRRRYRRWIKAKRNAARDAVEAQDGSRWA